MDGRVTTLRASIAVKAIHPAGKCRGSSRIAPDGSSSAQIAAELVFTGGTTKQTLPREQSSLRLALHRYNEWPIGFRSGLGEFFFYKFFYKNPSMNLNLPYPHAHWHSENLRRPDPSQFTTMITIIEC